MWDNGRLPPDSFLCHRAIVGWYLACPPVAGPLGGDRYVAAYLCRHDGERYAVVTSTLAGSISGGVEVLAVYLIGGNDTLTRLSYWPEQIELY